MFSHITIGANDIPAAKRLYDALFVAMGAEPGQATPDGKVAAYRHNGSALVVTTPVNGEPATFGNGVTIGFPMSSAEQVNAWHAAGLANGATAAEDPPGERNGPFGKMYLGYLRDQVGNKLCAVYRMG